MFMSVDLPDPDGPMMAANSPASIRRPTERNAATSMTPVEYDLAHVDQLDDRLDRGACRSLPTAGELAADGELAAAGDLAAAGQLTATGESPPPPFPVSPPVITTFSTITC